MMEQIIRIPISGSSGDPYEVIFHLSTDGLLKIKCNCRAGIFGPFCKHRIAIMNGDLSAATEPVPQWPLIESWIKATEFPPLVQEFQNLNHEMGILEMKLKALKAKMGDKMKTGVRLIT